MPISDYANAFFFARRNRVTPGRPPQFAVAIVISKRKSGSCRPPLSALVPSSVRKCRYVSDGARDGARLTAYENSPVKKFRDKNKKPGSGRAVMDRLLSDRLFRELRDLMRQPRNLSARIVLVNDLALRRPHELRL